jgi:adenine-specific DNA-methyltransferase
MAGIEKLDLESEDLVDDRLRQLRELVPEAFTEGGIDFDKLRLLLGDEVDEGDERYAFTWPGKADAIRQSQTSTTATLRPVVEKSRGRDGKDGSFDSDNIYIEGDNLEALKLLQRAYHSKVKMIYIDPPYNTGHDFVYKDKFGDTIENYKEQTGQANQSNPETSGRFHSDWCSMMYPRLELARELLAENGVVVISIDDNEVKNLRNLCDEVFGEGNFIASFVWQKRTSPDMRKIISAAHEYLVVYARNAQDRTCVRQLPYDEGDLKRYSNPDNDPNGPWISTDCTAQAGHGTPSQFYDMVTPAGRVVKLGSGLCWRYTKEKMNQEKWLRTSGITAGIPVAAPLHHMDERLMHPEERRKQWRRAMQAD